MMWKKFKLFLRSFEPIDYLVIIAIFVISLLFWAAPANSQQVQVLAASCASRDAIETLLRVQEQSGMAAARDGYRAYLDAEVCDQEIEAAVETGRWYFGRLQDGHNWVVEFQTAQRGKRYSIEVGPPPSEKGT